MSVDRLLSRGLALTLLAAVVGCGDDAVEVPHRDFVGHYTTARPNQMRDTLIHFEIRADSTVRYFAEDACGEYRSDEESYEWEALDDDTIVMTSVGGGWIDGTYKIRATRLDSCEELILEYFTSNWSLYTFSIYRGALCLSPSDGVCFAISCDGAADSCP